MKRRPAGFTLLEMLVAVAVLGVALVTLLGLQARNVKLIADSSNLTVASLLASSLATSTRAGALPSAGTVSGTFTDDDGLGGALDEMYGGSLAADLVWTRTVTVIPGLSNLRVVHIAVGSDAQPELATLDFLMRRGGP